MNYTPVSPPKTQSVLLPSGLFRGEVTEANRGKKRSDYTKKKMSNSALLAFKEGRRNATSGWVKKHTKEYKNIKYQSKYELYFLQYIETLNKLDEIEPGPKVQYCKF